VNPRYRRHKANLGAVRLVRVVLVAALGPACTPSDRAEPVDVAAVRAQIDSVFSGLTQAMIAGDTAAVGRFYTDSAVFAETGAPTMRSGAAIRSGTAAVFACCRYVESRPQPEITEVSGDRAFQFGTYRDVIQPTGQPPLAMFGRYSAVLERDSMNAWRISRIVVIRDSSVTLAPERR